MNCIYLTLHIKAQDLRGYSLNLCMYVTHDAEFLNFILEGSKAEPFVFHWPGF